MNAGIFYQQRNRIVWAQWQQINIYKFLDYQIMMDVHTLLKFNLKKNPNTLLKRF